MVQIDVSNVAMGTVICQMKNGLSHSTMFESCHLLNVETRYSAIERKLLAIVWAAKRLKLFCIGRDVSTKVSCKFGQTSNRVNYMVPKN
jgi:hypothetical protein